MKNIDIKDIFSSFRVFKRREFQTISSKARHDWKVMVIVFLALALAVIAGHYVFFRRIETGKSFSSTGTGNEGSATIIHKEMLEDTVIFFTERQTHLTELQNRKDTPSDPSL